jgi:hypothetical protein
MDQTLRFSLKRHVVRKMLALYNVGLTALRWCLNRRLPGRRRNWGSIIGRGKTFLAFSTSSRPDSYPVIPLAFFSSCKSAGPRVCPVTIIFVLFYQCSILKIELSVICVSVYSPSIISTIQVDASTEGKVVCIFCIFHPRSRQTHNSIVCVIVLTVAAIMQK